MTKNERIDRAMRLALTHALETLDMDDQINPLLLTIDFQIEHVDRLIVVSIARSVRLQADSPAVEGD